MTMSNPGSSWLAMPVTETVVPFLSKILTSEPARPPYCPDKVLQGTLEGLDHLWECKCGLLGVGSVPLVLTALLGGWVGGWGDLVVELCFLSSLMATSLRNL